MSNESSAYSNIDKIINDEIARRIAEKNKKNGIAKIIKFPVGRVPSKSKTQVKPKTKTVKNTPTTSTSKTKKTSSQLHIVKSDKTKTKKPQTYKPVVKKETMAQKVERKAEIKRRKELEKKRQQEAKKLERQRKKAKKVSDWEEETKQQVGRTVQAIMNGEEVDNSKWQSATYSKPKANVKKESKKSIVTRMKALGLALLLAGTIYTGGVFVKTAGSFINNPFSVSETEHETYHTVYLHNTTETAIRASNSALLQLKDTEYLLGSYLESKGYQFKKIPDESTRYGYSYELITDEDVTVSIEELETYWTTRCKGERENLREPYKAWEAHINYGTEVFNMDHVNIVYSKDKDTVDPYLQAKQEADAEKAANEQRFANYSSQTGDERE